MFAFPQTAVVGFSRISSSSASRNRTRHHFFIPHASFHHCGGFCCKSLKSHWLTPTSEPGHFFVRSARDTKHVSAWIPGACVRQLEHLRVLVLTLLFKSASRGLHFSQQSWLFRSGLLKRFSALLSKSLVPLLFVTLAANVTSGIPRRYSCICAKWTYAFFIVVLTISPHLLFIACLWKSLAARTTFKSIFGTIFALENLHRTFLGICYIISVDLFGALSNAHICLDIDTTLCR